MLMKFISVIVAVLFVLNSNSQNLHVSGKIGMGSYKGDLKPNGGLSQSSLGWGLGVKYDLSEHFIGRAYYNRTKLKADGAQSGHLGNLNFNAKLNEVALGIQYQIFSLNNKWWTPYLFLGGSIFSAKPYTDYGGQKVMLQPLGTEGQGYITGKEAYKTTNLALEWGTGIEYALNEDIRVGLEAGFRITGTDYIDDVSTVYENQATILSNRGTAAAALAYRGTGTYPINQARGNSTNKDRFYFVQATVSVRPFVNQWKRTSGIAGMKKDKRVGCPQTKGIF